MPTRDLGRSPIRKKDRPLRLPGESLTNRLDDLRWDFMEGGFMLIMFFGSALTLSLVWLLKTPLHVSLIVSWLAFLILAFYYLPKMRKLLAEVKRVKQGIEGERKTAEILNEVKTEKEPRFVLHDLVAGDFNIDHILLTEEGIFALETKNLAKYPGKIAQIYYDGKTVRVNETALPNCPLGQAQGNAKYLRELLLSTTGKSFPIRAVVVFPGWWVNQTKPVGDNQALVLSAKQLYTFTKDKSACITETDLRLAHEHLKTFCKSTAFN